MHSATRVPVSSKESLPGPHGPSLDSLLQPKLEIGKPDDRFEKEADAVADKVMMMPALPATEPLMAGNSDASVMQMHPATEAPEFQMKCEHCEEDENIRMKPMESLMIMTVAAEDDEEDAAKMKPPSGVVMKVEDETEKLQLKPGRWQSPGSSSYVPHDISARILSSQGGGQPLAPHVNAEMSQKIGADFSNVRIHTSSQAVQMSDAIGAQAFTYGRDIYFNEGKYSPESSVGKHLLAHELTHTVQQGAAVQTKPVTSGTQPKIQRAIGSSIRERLNGYAQYIPGWSLFTVIIGYNPLLGRNVERNGENLVGGLLGLIPIYGITLMNKLREHNILSTAFNWITQRLADLNLTVSRLEATISAAWDAMDFIRFDPIDYNIGVLRRYFQPLLNDVSTFASQVGTQILQMIKDALMSGLRALANAFPGYPLLTKILGTDPLTGQPVVSTTAEKIEDFLRLIGKERELEKMRQEGTIQQTADWLDAELAQLNFSFDEISRLFQTAWDAFSMADLLNPVAAFTRTVAIFQPFVSRVTTFAGRVAVRVLEIIKDALLRRLSEFARQQRGYHLLTVLLGRDPFTNEVVERNVENIIRGFMSLMEGGEEQFQQMKETGAIQQTTDRVNAAVDELGFNLDYIVGLFIGLWRSFTIDDIFDPMGAFRRIVDTLGEPLTRLFVFIVRIVRIVIEVLLEVMRFPTDTIRNIIANAQSAFEDIKRDPIGFLKNLLRAVKRGFSQFFDNILTHLLNGLRDWLFGELSSAGVQPPADLSFQSILGFVLNMLGISMENVWERLALKVGPQRVAQIRSAIDTLSGIWTFIKDVYERGPIAIWEYVQQQLSNLWDMVIGMIRNWIMERVITQVTTRLLSMLDPTGVMAVVNSFIAFYRAVQSFIEKLREMLELVNSFVAGVANIARGDISQAANYLENALARSIPIAIGFLANQVGLRGLGARISEMIEGLRERVNGAIDWLIDRALAVGGALLNAGRSAVGAVMNWLGINRNFRATDGEQHRLYTERTGNRTTLMVASGNPQPVRQFLSSLNLRNNANLIRKRDTIQSLLQDSDSRIAILASPPAGTTERQLNAHREQLEANSVLISNNLADLMALSNRNEIRARTTDPTYDGSIDTMWGRGMRVQILNTPPPGGSETDASTNGSWSALRLRKEQRPDGRTLYVKGHLLNNHLGGPGNNWNNLTPLTQAANGEFERDAERYLKNKLTLTTHSGGTDTGILFIYTVIPVYSRSVNASLISRINAVPTGPVSISGSPPAQLTISDRNALVDIVTQERLVPTAVRYTILAQDPETDQVMSEFTIRNHQIRNSINQTEYILSSGTFTFP